jgi:HPt (histidine-containing phosphotransfer) domain-containing protein
MTAHVLPGDRERCLDAGMNGYIAKPVRAEQLYSEILRVVRRDSLRVESPGVPASEKGEVDWQEALAAVQGDKKLLGELVAAAITDTTNQWQAIREAVATGDEGGLRAAAHKLKGAIRYFGKSAAYQEALHLEKMARDGQLEETQPWIAKLGRSLESLRCELTQCVIK